MQTCSSRFVPNIFFKLRCFPEEKFHYKDQGRLQTKSHYMSYLSWVDSFIALCFLKAPDPGRQDLYEEVGRENTILISSVEIDKIKPSSHFLNLLWQKDQIKSCGHFLLWQFVQGGEQLLNISPPLLPGKKVNGEQIIHKRFLKQNKVEREYLFRWNHPRIIFKRCILRWRGSMSS